MSAWTEGPGEAIPWSGLHVVVCGIGVSGNAAALVLLARGAHVVVVDRRESEAERVNAAALRTWGADVHLGADADTQLADTDPVDLVVTSPGWRPDHPLLSRLEAVGVPVWGEVELAWRLTPPGVSWLAVTGTNGKTTATEMLAAMLTAAGRRVVAAGNIGEPLVQVVLADPAPEVIAVELSSFQLHWSRSVRPDAAALLNIAPDHYDWHGSPEAYTAAKARIWARMGAEEVAIANADDPAALAALADAPAGRRISFALAPPQPGMLGVADGVLLDRAFGDHVELGRIEQMRVDGAHNVSNALAAAALARAVGTPGDAIAQSLREFRTGAHRLATVADVDGVRYVDDSKATNPHAAGRALESYPRVVWIAGGLNKGLRFDDLIRTSRDHLVAAVLIGSCAEQIRDALGRYAPDVPVIDAADLHTAVAVARDVARPGDTVLLAPAAASMDMFRSYAERGDAFAEAVHALTGGTT